MSLPLRLLLLIAVALLPALTLQLGWEVQAQRERERIVHEDALRLARLVAAEQERVVEGARQLLTALGKAPPLLNGDFGTCRAFIGDLLNDFPRYANITATDTAGRITCSIRAGAPGRDLSDRAYFQDAMRSGGFVAGEFIEGRATGRAILPFAQTYRDREGNVLGVVVASLDLLWLGEQLGRFHLPPGTTIALMDRHGTVLAHRPPVEGIVGRPALPHRRALMARPEAGAEMSPGLDGTSRILGYVPLEDGPEGMFVTVALDASSALAQARRANLLGLALIAAGSLLALLLTWLGARRLVWRPTEALLRAAERWRAGELSARVAGDAVSSGGREFTRLAAAFDAMAATLQAREAALAGSEARLRLATEGAGVGTWQIDLATGQGVCSAEAAALSGIGRREYTAEDWEAAVHPEDRALDAEAWARAMRDGAPYEVECRAAAPAPDGGERWLLTRGRVERDAEGRPVRGAGVLMDITARRRAELAHAEGEARLRLAVRSARLGIWELDLVRSCWRLDQRAVEITGACVPPDVWIPAGGPEAQGWFRSIYPEDREAREAAHARIRSGVTELYEAEYRVPRGGRWGWISQQALVVERNPRTGAPLRLVGVAIDMTERRDLQSELERQVAERTAALRESEARLAQAAKLEALGRLAGGVAHDFNNVLQAVQGGIALATKRLEHDPEGARRFLGLAADATERGATVTGRLLAFARRGDLSVAPVEVAPMLENLAEILRHTLGPGVSLEVEVDGSLPAVLADSGQLESVLVNLANNARDALPASRGRIALAAAMCSGADLPEGLQPGTYVRLSVTDDGEGMSPEVLARVTEPFFTTKPKGRGTGLGLAMARGFAEQSGGALTIWSRQGLGTAVSLWLPGAPEGVVATAARPGARGLPQGPGAALLVVDDERDVRMVLAASLAERGHLVSEAEDGPAALACLERSARVDALVTDLAMPGGMDGLALLREARQRRPGLPGLLVTGHVGDAAPDALAEAMRSGPFAVLRKPVSAEAVEAELLGLLQRARPAGSAAGRLAADVVASAGL